MPNLRSAHSDHEEDQKRARHDGHQVGHEKKTRSAHDFQVQPSAQAEAHRAEWRHHRYRDRHSGQDRHAIAASAANHHRTRQTRQQPNSQVEQIGIRAGQDLGRSGMKRQQLNQETRKGDRDRDADKKIEHRLDSQVEIAQG